MLYTIGDIHGGYKALKDVLDQVNFNYDNDQLISLGDVCDGWSETAECIELLMSIKKLIYIKGNHDEWAYNLLKIHQNNIPINILDEYRSWHHHGGFNTIKSYVNNPHLLDKHLQFLKCAKEYHIDSDNNLFIHAGYRFTHVPGRDNIPDSDFYWSRDFWSDAYKGMAVAKEFNKVYIGHTPTLNYPNSNKEHLYPMIRNNVINMDTGACFTGRLSLLNLETNEVIQSKLRVMEYYPNEKGRNAKSFNEMFPIF